MIKTVVLKVNDAIVDNAIVFLNIYSLDSGAIQRLKDQMTLFVRY